MKKSVSNIILSCTVSALLMSGCANDGSTGADGADGNTEEVTITAVDGYERLIVQG
jgi:PBP1b-binding outer membrane lipoprotein LpoB